MFSIFSVAFGMLGTFVKTLLANPKLLIALLIAGALGFAAFKYYSLQDDLEEAKNQVVLEQNNNGVLRNNVDVLSKANQDNEVVITQLKADQATALASVGKLTASVAAVNRSLGAVGQKLEAISVPPAPLSPYLREAIKGIQAQRDAESSSSTGGDDEVK